MKLYPEFNIVPSPFLKKNTKMLVNALVSQFHAFRASPRYGPELPLLGLTVSRTSPASAVFVLHRPPIANHKKHRASSIPLIP